MAIIIIYLKKLFLYCKVVSLQQVLNKACEICKYKVKEETPERAHVDVFLDGKPYGTLVFEFNPDHYVMDIHE